MVTQNMLRTNEGKKSLFVKKNIRFVTALVLYKSLNPLTNGGGWGGVCRGFCPLLKISLLNPYLKIHDLAKLFVADAPMKKKILHFCFTLSQSNLKYMKYFM